jgi:hypothetical protein
MAIGVFDQNSHRDLALALNRTSSLAVLLSNAITPQTGTWWNPAESGRGFTIEKQGDNVFMAAYLYDASGTSNWYGAGPSAMTGPTFSAPLIAFANGQTLTGAYVAPISTPSPGNISITFTDSTHGNLTWPEGTIPIERFAFVADGLTLPHGALEPQPGWWWNPSESGRGFAVEVQGGEALIASYMYDGAGDPVWYLSGPTPLLGSLYQGTWDSYAGGQTLTGPYQPPTGVTGSGSLTIQFTSRTAATLTLPNGRQIPIQRFSF